MDVKEVVIFKPIGAIMKRVLVVTVIFAAAGSALAQSPVYKTDPQTGNQYRIQQYGNETRIHGSNPRTGSTWSQTQSADGSYRGFDSHGNSYRGNHNTGSYSNSNGTTCFGTGASRVCN